MQRQKLIVPFGADKATREKLARKIGHDVYVSPKQSAADVREAMKIWADYVKEASDGKYRGEIRDYYGKGEPWNTGDLRDTWTLMVLDGERVISTRYFLPWEDQQGDRPFELADEVAQGVMTLAQANKIEQYESEHAASLNLEGWIDSGALDGMFEDHQGT